MPVEDQTDAELKAIEDAAALADQQEAEGFGAVQWGDTPASVQTAAVEKPSEVEPVVEIPPVVVEPPPAVYAQLTPEQLNDILAKTNSVPEVRAAVKKLQDDSAGRIGSLEQIVRTMQANAPVGKPIEVSDKDLEEFTKEFPELGVKLARDLTKVLSKFKGTSEPVAVETPEAFVARVTAAAQPLVIQAVDAERRALAPKILASRHKDFTTVIGAPGTQSAWRTWIKTQPGGYETRMLESWDGFELADSLDTFKSHVQMEKDTAEKAKKVTPQPVSLRTTRLAQAIPAKGGAVVNTKPQILTEQDAFNAAVNSVVNS